jgi:hypothetical protein
LKIWRKLQNEFSSSVQIAQVDLSRFPTTPFPQRLIFPNSHDDFPSTFLPKEEEEGTEGYRSFSSNVCSEATGCLDSGQSISGPLSIYGKHRLLRLLVGAPLPNACV